MENIWLKEYAPGVPAEIDVTRYNSLLDIVDESLTQFASRRAYINLGGEMTFAQVDEKSKAFAAYLQSLGLKKGDSVAVMMPNLLQYPIALFGIIRAGLIAVNVNPMYTARELKHQLNDSGAKTILIVENFAHTLAEVVEDTPIENIILTQLGDQLPGLKRFVVNFVVKHVKKMVPAFSLKNTISFNAVLAKGARLPYSKPEINPEDIAVLQYTGGTTGVSKGAMLSHRNLVANLEQVSAILTGQATDDEMVVTALPLYHIFAFTVNFLTFLKIGGANLLITNPRDLPAFVKELQKYKFTAITAVNTLFNGLLNTPGFKDLDFSHLKLAVGGGMAVQRPVAERWEQITKVRLLEGYGLTECAPVATFNQTNVEHYNGSIGLPIPSTQCRLVNEQGEVITDTRVPGELQVKGPQVMLGYYNRPDATAEVLTKDGWLSTGDIAEMDDKGFFYIVDRKKDMILVSGFNVFPNEVEEVVASHDDVVEVAAIGVPHEVSGEVVKVFVVRKGNALSEQDVIQHCRDNLTAYKVPKLVEFRDDLPKTNVGKILRRELRAN